MPDSGPVIEVQGARELAAAMTAAAGDAALFLQAAQEGARIVAAQARGNAPSRSGRLRGSIQGHGEPGAAVITAGVVYGGNQEWGWRDRPNVSRGWRGGPFEGHHMIYRAMSDTEADQMNAYAANAETVLDRIAASTPRA
jgi:hypothetical protein